MNGHTATATTTGGTNNPTFSLTSTGNNSTNGSAVTVYAGDVVNLPAETFGGGASAAQYNSSVSCSGGTTLASGAVARSITISNSTTATVCTYTNTRATASVTLRKVWSGAATNDTAALSLKRGATTVDTLNSTVAAASQTDTDSTPFAAYVGETLNLSETLGGSNTGQYTATLSCDNGVTVAGTGDFTVPTTATICTITNTRKTRTVTLSKSLSPTTDAGKFNLVVNGSTVASNIGNGGTGNLIVPVGSAVSISETAGTSTVLGNYASSLSCTGVTGVTGTTSATFTQPDADVACTFNNTRRSASLTIVKQWQNGRTGDAISIAATTGLTNNTTVLASTSAGSNSTTGNPVTVYAGETATLGSETFTTGSAANYTASLSCRGAADTNLADGLTISPADTAITCTYTNARKSATLTLSKTWASGSIAGNTVTVTSNGFGTNATSGTSTATAAGNTTTGTAVTVYAGESGTISETFGTGTANNYNAVLSCTGNSTPLSANTLTINPADTAISCGYTNTPVSTDLAIEKTGTSSVTQGNTVSYSIKVWNKGSGTASSSTFTDTVPNTLSNVIWSCTASGSAVCGTASGSGNSISVTTGALPVNNTTTAPTTGSYLTFTVNATANTVGTVNNTATIAVTSGTDPVSSNNSSTASTTVNAPAAIVISGQVFEDNSGTTGVNSNAYNAVKDAGETGIAGSQVRITNCGTTTIATTQTNANGEYSFSLLPTDLPSGSFCIVQTNLTGYSSVSGTAGYNRATDRITVSNTGASSYSNHNFGDARLTALLSEDGQQTITAGGVADYPHRLTAQSVLTISSLNQTTSQQPANSSDQNWQAVVYRDSNCNGKVDSGESLFSQSLPLTLKNAEEVCLVQRVYAPATASMGAQHLGQLQASYNVTLADSSQITGTTLQRQDTTLLGSAGLTMQKGVRSVAGCPSTSADTGSFTVQNQVQSGGYLEYEITYRNNSTKNLIDVSIKDSVPTGTVYKTASCTSTPSGSCNPSHTNGALLWQTGGTLLPNQQGKVRFCVQVP